MRHDNRLHRFPILIPLLAFLVLTVQLAADPVLEAGRSITEVVPGAQIAIWSDGEIVASRSFGIAGPDEHDSVTNEMMFPVFSASKAWTVTIAARLAEQAKLDPQAPVGQLIPEYPQKRWDFTAMQLATHTAGIRHYRDEREATAPRRCTSVAEAVEIFAEDPLLFEPGTDRRYSSWGYVLLSRVLEKAGNMSFSSLMNDLVLQPSSMEHTVHASQLGKTHDFTQSFRRTSDQHELVEIDPSCKWGAGGYYSTAADLARFYGALLDGRLTSERFVMMILRADQDGRFTFGGFSEVGMSKIVGDIGKGTIVSIVTNESNPEIDLQAIAMALLESRSN